jgi:uncharacterized membrane protein YfcA
VITLLAASSVLTDLTTGGSTLAAGVATVVGATGVAQAARRSRRRDEQTASRVAAQTAQVTLEDKLTSLSKSMRQSAKLVEEVSAELDAREATARRLQQEAQDAEALAALHRDQTEAVRRLLDTELVGQRKGIRKDAIIVGIFSFVLGVGGTLLVTLLVHPIH